MVASVPDSVISHTAHTIRYVYTVGANCLHTVHVGVELGLVRVRVRVRVRVLVSKSRQRGIGSTLPRRKG